MAKGYKSRYTVNAARQALARANRILGKRGTGIMGVASSRGFKGVYNQYAQRLRGTSYGSPYSSGSELKFTDVEVTGSAVTTAGVITLLNGVAQGTDYTQRIGRKTCMKSILWNAALLSNGGTIPLGDMIRLLIVYDTQPNSATPAVTDILAVADPFSPMNLNNRDRFHTIFDHKLPLNPAAFTTGVPTAGNPISYYKQKYKKLSKDVIFSGTGATAGSIQTGAVWMLQISYLTAAYNLDSYTRIRFHDS